MKRIVNMSGGVCSFFAAKRVIDKYGTADVTLLFADVMMEDQDLYRFLRECAVFLNVPVTIIGRGITPWELFAKENMIGNSRAPLCSVRLKREQLHLWHKQNCVEMDTIIYVGIDWTEVNRIDDLRKAKPDWTFEAPMTEAPFISKCDMLDELKRIGIAPPRLYAMGFPHNNCGGFCVKAGHAQFALLWRVMPERFLWHEEQERKLRAKVGDFSVLTDRRGGKKNPMSLEAFRHRIEAGEDFDRDDWGGCGCAMDIEEAVK